MRLGNELVEQVTKTGIIFDGYDESLSASEIFKCFARWFPNIHQSPSDSRFLIGDFNGHKYAIRCKNVTYLGNPHPHFKKRIQISDDLFEFYDFAMRINATPFLMGIYSNGDNLIFVNFGIETYIEKKAHNSSAHIYVSDLAAATEDGYFQKFDFFNNSVTAFRPDIVHTFLHEELESRSHFSFSTTITHPVSDENVAASAPNTESRPIESHEIQLETSLTEVAPPIELESVSDTVASLMGDMPEQVSGEYAIAYSTIFRDEIVPKFHDFFEAEEKNWNGIECYQKMIAENYRNKYQPEWVGFFLEFEFEKYLNTNKLTYLITYAQDKRQGGIDLDLFFPTIESYGDLKAHSEESRGIAGNDWDTVIGIINGQDEKNHVYYIVCEHSTEKDNLHDFEVTKYWNTKQNKSDLMSYATRMKHHVQLKRVYILDINVSNKEYLTMFRQGVNSDGKPRAPKIMIEQDNLEHFVINQFNL